MRVVVINDTGHKAHFGCQMVMSAYRQLLKGRDIELVGTQRIRAPWHSDSNRRMLDQADLVLVNGEGSIHHNRFIDLLRIAEEYPCVLMNCVFEDMATLPYLKHFKHVTVRESMSADYMEVNHGRRPEIVPDLIFAHAGILARSEGRGTFVADSVVDLSLCTIPVGEPQYVKKMSAYQRACCGRFHAICIAAMLRMPFSAWRSNTWKNKAIMADMGIPELYADDQQEAMILVPDKVSNSVRQYVNDAIDIINNLFDRMANKVFDNAY